MHNSRRQFLKTVTFLSLAGHSDLLSAQETDTLSNRVASIISEYSAQGIHRTGTDVDNLSGQWLADRITLLGISPVLEPFPLDRIVQREGLLKFGQFQLPGIPAYDCNYTDANGVTGRLGELGSNADIGVVMTGGSMPAGIAQALEQARQNNHHRGIVLVTDATYSPDGISIINGEHFSAPIGPPVLHVANNQWTQLQRAMAAGDLATLIAHCDREVSSAFNVRATIPGSDPGLAPIVVMTPRSGWWRCASERGGGIALFLEILRAVSLGEPRRTVRFTANSGHELGHIGMGKYLQENAGLLQGAAMWIHLGANFAARGSAIRLQFSNAENRDSTLRELALLGLVPAVETPLGNRPLGEARNIFDGGGQYISILGNNPWFHHPDDLWPTAVNLETTAYWAEAFNNLVVTLSQRS